MCTVASENKNCTGCYTKFPLEHSQIGKLIQFQTVHYKTDFTFFFFYSCIVPLEFLPWQIHVTFPRERQLWQSRYQTYGACWVFRCFHNPSNSDMDYRIFNVHTDVDACSYTQGCTDSIRESSLKVHSGRPIPCRTVNQTYLSGVLVQRSTKWAKPSFFLRLVQISESTFLFRCLIYRHNSSRDFTLH